MRTLFTEDKIILSHLYKKWKLHIFELYVSEEALSIAQIVQFVQFYKEIGYIILVKDWIIKTPKGYFAIRRMMPYLHCSSDNSWKEPPEIILRKPLGLNRPFKRISFKDIN